MESPVKVHTITSCSECGFVTYFSYGCECGKKDRKLVSDKKAIPPWCPLPDAPAQESGPKIKTNWNGLSEEAKEVFADFYITVSSLRKHGYEEEAGELCPLTNQTIFEKSIKRIETEQYCDPLCVTLFPEIDPYNKADCPCFKYGDQAFKILKNCLIEDGWISDDDE